MEGNSVDLIYLDPPFNSNRAYNIIYGDDIQSTAFEDTWYWGPHCDEYLEELRKGDKTSAQTYDILHALISALGKIQLCAYLVNMGIRLIEMRRVLKNTGSIYLHCDPTASHYIKILMDCIFGQKNFRREIIWNTQNASGFKAGANNWIRDHDTILFYRASSKTLFKKQYKDYSDITLAMFRNKDKDGRLYYDRNDGRRDYLDERKGVALTSVWSDIGVLQGSAKQYLGYPTQKPIELLDRIVQASSKKGDLVLDPFCGCGTTIAAAEKHGRQWIGIDITCSATAAIRERFRRQKLDIWGKIEEIGMPKSPKEVKETMIDVHPSLRARKEFEKFCVITVKGLPNDKMGADGGIDGVIQLKEGKRAIISVKSGKVSVKDVRELKGILKNSQPIGIFITYEPPTRDMTAFVKEAGIYQGDDDLLDKDDSRTIPILQIFSQQDLFDGKRPILPQ